MNTTKALAKFVYRWAADNNLGAQLSRRANQLIDSLKMLRLTFCPIINFKDDKFGGWVAETYRAMLMVGPWLFRILEEKALKVKAFDRLLPGKDPNDYTLQEYNDWLTMQGIKASTLKQPEAKSKVMGYINSRRIPPLKKPPHKNVSVADMRSLVQNCHHIFATLFSRDGSNLSKMANHLHVSAQMFLSQFKNPDKIL
jgi:hypothetical protein